MISDGVFAPAKTGSDWCKMKGTQCGFNGECVNYQNFGTCECQKVSCEFLQIFRIIWKNYVD